MPEAALSLGSNMGDKAGHIAAAIDHLTASGDVALLRRSHLYRTEPWGDPDQDHFLNACALVATELRPLELLDRCLAAETAGGRTRDESRRWGPRMIDVDLLLYGTERMDHPRLILPHPRLLERAFVLVPLAEIAPDSKIGDVLVKDAAGIVDRSGIQLWRDAD